MKKIPTDPPALPTFFADSPQLVRMREMAVPVAPERPKARPVFASRAQERRRGEG